MERICEKRRFNKQEARLVLKKSKKGHKWRRERRMYECDVCLGWWHVSSMEEFNVESIECNRELFEKYMKREYEQ